MSRPRRKQGQSINFVMGALKSIAENKRQQSEKVLTVRLKAIEYMMAIDEIVLDVPKLDT